MSNFVECQVNSLNLWEKEPIDTTINQGFVSEYAPTNDACLGASFTPVQFVCPGTEYFTDLTQTELYMELKVEKADGTVAEEAGTTDGVTLPQDVSLINNMMSSCFRQFECRLNDVLVSGETTNYAYKAYFLNLVNYSVEAKDSWLQYEGMYNDNYDATNINPITVVKTSSNNGLKSRHTRLGKSNSIVLVGRIADPLFSCLTFLLPQVKIELNFMKSSDGFKLLSTEANTTFRVNLEKIRLRMRNINVRADIRRTLEQKLMHTPAWYSMPSCLSVRTNILQYEIKRPWNEEIPKRMWIAIVTNTAYTGGLTHDPFRYVTLFLNFYLYINFYHLHRFDRNGVNGISVRIDSVYYSLTPKRIDWTSLNHADLYVMLMKSLNLYGRNINNGITPENFTHGHVIYGFSFDPLVYTECWQQKRVGNLLVTFDFEAATTTPLVALFFGEFSRSFSIFHNRTIEVNPY